MTWRWWLSASLPHTQTRSHVHTLFSFPCVLMGGLNSSRCFFLTANRICPQGQIATWREAGGKLQIILLKLMLNFPPLTTQVCVYVRYK